MKTKEPKNSINHEIIVNKDNLQKIKLERINLKSCNINFFPAEKSGDEKLSYSLSPSVFKNLLLSELHIRIVNSIPNNDQFVQILNFSLIGIFTVDEGITKEAIGDFGTNYSISILWPYAREFSQDIFQRAGFPAQCLPIINAQEVTKDMVDKGLIKVKFQDPENINH